MIIDHDDRPSYLIACIGSYPHHTAIKSEPGNVTRNLFISGQ